MIEQLAWYCLIAIVIYDFRSANYFKHTSPTQTSFSSCIQYGKGHRT